MIERGKTYFCESNKGVRIHNIPNTGTMTGNFFIDMYGCWWEYRSDATGKLTYIIGDYPEEGEYVYV